MKLIVAFGLALVLVGCTADSVPKGSRFYGSPFLIIDTDEHQASLREAEGDEAIQPHDPRLLRRSTSSQ